LLFDALKLVIKNGGCDGLDDRKVSELKGREWEFAKDLSQKLKAGTYKPGVVLRLYIPKKDGRKRPLGIPKVEDRVVQRVLVLLVETIYEQNFYDFSYGFRPPKRAVNCVAPVAKQVHSHRHVLEADIENFFNEVSHNKLLKFIEKEIVDKRILRLISKILKAGFSEFEKTYIDSIELTSLTGV